MGDRLYFRNKNSLLIAMGLGFVFVCGTVLVVMWYEQLTGGSQKAGWLKTMLLSLPTLGMVAIGVLLTTSSHDVVDRARRVVRTEISVLLVYRTSVEAPWGRFERIELRREVHHPSKDREVITWDLHLIGPEEEHLLESRLSETGARQQAQRLADFMGLPWQATQEP